MNADRSPERNNPKKLREKIAELPSLYSDMKMCISISANISNARSALIFLYISLYYQYWETSDLVRAIGQKAFAQNYNGEWKIVQDFLETKLQTPEDFEQKYCSIKGPHDFFGNFLPVAAKRYIKLLKHKDLTKKDKRKVTYAQFHRGYKDKGSLRLPSSFHGIKPYREKEDRRSKIQHPLLVENFSTIEDVSEIHIPEKGGEIRDYSK